VEERSKRIEDSVTEVWRFVPNLARTHVALLTRPRQYFRSVRDHQQLPGTVTPVSLWLANVVIVTGLRLALGKSGAVRSWQDALNLTSLLVGVALLALYLLLALDLRDRDTYPLVLRVVFSGAIVFIPLFALKLIRLPEVIPQKWLESVIQGTPSPLGWQHWLVASLYLGLLLAWCWVMALGISVIFRRSRISVAFSLVSALALVISSCVLFVGVMWVKAVRTQVGVAARGLGPARTAMLQTPPDYAAATRAFDQLYSSELPLVDRNLRLGARIGSVAAGRAGMAVFLKRPELEKQFYQSIMRVLAGNNQEAAALLLGALDEMQHDPMLGKALGPDSAKGVDEVRRMLEDESYEPSVPKKTKETEHGLRIPWPSLFP